MHPQILIICYIPNLMCPTAKYYILVIMWRLMSDIHVSFQVCNSWRSECSWTCLKTRNETINGTVHRMGRKAVLFM